MIILDVNTTMNQTLGSSGSESRLKVALEAVRMLLEQKLLNNPKHEVALVLSGTPNTNNRMHENYGDAHHFSNISVVRSPQPVDLNLFRQVQGVQPTPASAASQITGASMLDALQVGIDILTQHCGARKYKKRMFLMTDGERSEIGQRQGRVDEDVATVV